MTTMFFIHPLNGRSPSPREPQGTAVEGLPWGTPTGAEVERLLDTVQETIEGTLVRRSEAIALLNDCHTMLRRCQGALAPATAARGEEVAA